MARVLGRLRISRDTEASTSIDRQREAINRWAVMKDHVIIGWATDRDLSGSVSPFDAPELGPWLNERADEWDILVSWKLDRLGRGLFDMADLFRYCEKYGKSLATIDDNVDISTPMGKFVATILAGVAEMERENVRTRVRNQREAARKSGAWTGGNNVPYGYKPVKRDGQGYDLVPDPETSKIVQEIFDLATKQSVSSICRLLNERGVPAPRAEKWGPSTLLNMIRSRHVLGYVEHDGNLVIGEDGNPVRREPLVSESVRARAIGAVAEGRRPIYRKHETALLSGLLYCGKCGNRMHSYRATAACYPHRKEKVKCPDDCAGRKDYSYYRCNSKMNNRRCNAGSIRMDWIDKWAEDDIMSEIGGIERKERVKVSGGDPRVIADLTERINDLTRQMSESDDDDDDLAEEIRELKALRKAERNKGEEYRDIPLGETYRAAWDRMDTHERRALLTDAGITITARMDGDKLWSLTHINGTKTLEIVPDYVPARIREGDDEPLKQLN